MQTCTSSTQLPGAGRYSGIRPDGRDARPQNTQTHTRAHIRTHTRDAPGPDALQPWLTRECECLIAFRSLHCARCAFGPRERADGPVDEGSAYALLPPSRFIHGFVHSSRKMKGVGPCLFFFFAAAGCKVFCRGLRNKNLARNEESSRRGGWKTGRPCCVFGGKPGSQKMSSRIWVISARVAYS